MKGNNAGSVFLNLYPVWIISASFIAFLYPPAFAWFTGNWMVWGLTLVMLGMGFTLQVDDFKRILSMPGAVILGFLVMYTIMPLSAWGISRVLGLEQGLAIGLIIVGCCPGGTASNVIAFIARANVALSVTLTTISTLGGIIVKPLLCEALVGKYIPVDAWGIFLTMVQVILAPVLIGVLCNKLFPKAVAKVAVAGPYVSVTAIIFIAGGIVAQSAHAIADNSGVLFLAASLLHIIGFLSGFAVSRLFRYDMTTAKTLSIETGMQNGGLAAVLAKANFPLQPLAAVPAIFSSVIQTLIGGILAAYWRWQSGRKTRQIKDHSQDKVEGTVAAGRAGYGN